MIRSLSAASYQISELHFLDDHLSTEMAQNEKFFPMFSLINNVLVLSNLSLLDGQINLLSEKNVFLRKYLKIFNWILDKVIIRMKSN